MIERNEGTRALLTFAGLGTLRPAPGTWGSLPPVVLGLGLGLAGLGPGTLAWYGVFAAVALVFTLGCGLLGDEGEAWWGKDPSNVVADEVAGMALVLALFPPTIDASSGWFSAWLLGAFLIFRIADIVKPWPARQWQRIPGGWGIVLDDLASAVHAAVPIVVLGLLLPAH
ncbi:MAG: phosphatidylglycerophosphatase A [Phycisphaerales bacterium JB040]